MGFPVIRSGELRKRIKFQSRTSTQDSSTGEITESWVDVFTCWASLDPASGRELIAAAAQQSAITHVVVVRFRSELASPRSVADMRIVYGSRGFNIVAALNQDERNRAIVLHVEEGLLDAIQDSDFNILTEAGDNLVTEAGSAIIQE
jgi:SPP1 family predicted phage head-tail adaptor